MTRANTNSKSRTPKVQRKYLPKDVLKVMNVLPRDPILDLMKSAGSGRNLAAPEPVLRAYYLSRLPDTWVPEKPHAVWRQLKDDWRNLASMCGFEKVPCWETLRVRFKLLAEEYGNEVAIRLFELKQELEKGNIGKKTQPVIAKHQQPRRREPQVQRSNYWERKVIIENAFDVFEMVDVAGTEELAERSIVQARWPDGRPRCPRPGCGSDQVTELPSKELRQWLCLECEEHFDVKTATVFEGTDRSLRVILWAAYFIIQLPFGMPSLDLARLLREKHRKLSNKDAVDLTHRIQAALVEPQPRFAGPVQIDDSLMGYANGVRANLIARVDTLTRQVWAEPIYGPVNQSNSGSFIDRGVEEDGEIHTDSTDAYPKRLRRRHKVNHSKNVFARNGKRKGERIGTNLNENYFSTFQEFLDRRRAVTAAYFPLYLAEHQWRYNHRSEPVIDQLQAFIRKAHDVVLRGDGKPGEPLEVERMLAVQLALHPPHSGAEKARNRERRSRLAKKEVVQQLRLPGF